MPPTPPKSPPQSNPARGAASYSILATGVWRKGQVQIEWIPSTHETAEKVERAIDAAWSEAQARLGDKLFDGPMCRLECFSAEPSDLHLVMSRTSYRSFLGTNQMNAGLTKEFGDKILANPIGVSTALETADNFLLMGRRNDSVAYYPRRVHPFAGALEPRDDLDVFDDVRRELHEELAMMPEYISDIACIGVAEDNHIRHPELIFHVKSLLTRQQIEATLDPTEHGATFAVKATKPQIVLAMVNADLTPIALATIELWARVRFT